jgi:hypothetical protein
MRKLSFLAPGLHTLGLGEWVEMVMEIGARVWVA